MTQTVKRKNECFSNINEKWGRGGQYYKKGVIVWNEKILRTY